ncbi:MAG: MFS transporter, partial [Anaerolineae bacterium]|nr:MFS transporter [Anaerolineae bacterium]
MTTSEPTTIEKIRSLRWSYASNAANAVFVQFTYFGSAFVLFLNQLGFDNTQIGFLLSLFPFLGLVALFIAPRVARFGYKRTYVTFWALRKVITVFLLFVPWVLSEFGYQVALIYIGVIVFGFGLCRSIAETGYYPWVQEFVPDSIRGKYSATNNMFASLVGIVAVTFASFVLELPGGLERFMFLFAVGIAFGVIGVWSVSHLPGGAPLKGEDAPHASFKDLWQVAKDRNLILYVAGIGLLTLASSPVGSFLPLFMQDYVGLSEGNVVLLQNATLIGTLLCTYFLGWAADRYGSKPVMLSGIYIKLLFPIVWFVMPRFSDISLPLALTVAFFQGISGIAWAIGSTRLLYTSIVPREKKTEYMAVYYAAVGIIGGASQLLGGKLLDVFAGLNGQLGVFTIDPFTPLFVLAFVLPIVSLLLFRGVRADSDVSVGEFAGLFTRGNPFFALESLIGYYRSKDERRTVVMTERLGQSKSPLTVDELLEALSDPRFNVRFESIISISRTKSHPRLVEALCNIVEGTELSLTVVAAWALGRIGDAGAIPTLRNGLNSDYRSVRAHCARALGTLGDVESAPLLLERLNSETDKGLCMAYASALGNLGSAEAVDKIVAFLGETDNEGARFELVLALARMVDGEHTFI